MSAAADQALGLRDDRCPEDATPSFHHSDPGTCEARWLQDPRWDAVASAAAHEVLAPVERLIVLSPHPDDESLGCGGLISTAARCGMPVDLVVATDGEAAPSRTASRREVGQRRRQEVLLAAGRLGDQVRVHLLGLPDGDLGSHVDAASSAVADLLDERDTLLVTTWGGDGHPDHTAAAQAVRHVQEVAASRSGGDLLLAHYLVWLWHWGVPDDLPWGQVQVVDLDLAAHRAKQQAVGCHGSQLGAAGAGDDPDAIVNQRALERATRLVEVLLRPEGQTCAGADISLAQTFDELYASTPDPWQQSSWYEERKRDLVLAALSRPTYGRVLDLGCATGELTQRLLSRAGHVTAVDVSTRALEAARERLEGDADDGTRVSWLRGQSPQVLHRLESDSGPFDLVVMSEVGYFHTGHQLLAALRAARRLVDEGGEIVLVHWRHSTRRIPLDGPAVHAQARTALDLPVRVEYVDDDVLLTIFGGLVL